MARIIEMPKLSDTMEEGRIARWLVKEGDSIEVGDPIAEIETDKATMEYGSPDDGTILKIIVPSGGQCALNAPIAVIGEPSENPDSVLGKSAAPGQPKVVPAHSVAQEVEAKGQPVLIKSTAVPQKQESSAAMGEQVRIKTSPLARKMAAELGLDLSSIKGSGPKGRIVARDLAHDAPQAAAPVPQQGATQDAPPLAIGSRDEIVPLTMMRKTIAKRLLAGKNDAPHFYLTVSTNMTKLIAWRKELNADEASKKVSVNDLLILATARALHRHPEVNASWQKEHIVRFGSVHIALAVALPEGLVTPVVRNADSLGVRGIAKASSEMIEKAKAGKLVPEDYQNGTFTISNLGMMGIEEFTAIINPPQAAILAIGATIAMPWVDPSGQIVVQPRMKMTLSCDHRVIDGAMGAKFLQTLVGFIEDPLMMLS